MKNRKMFKGIALLLAVVMVFALTGCETSSTHTSSTTVTTSVTDENGNTTTNTMTSVTDADGNTTTTNTTTESGGSLSGEDAEASESDWDELAGRMYSLYDIGAEGTNEAGDTFYYAFSEDEGDMAALIIVSADGMNYWGREGTVEPVEDHVVLRSDSMGDETPYVFSEVDEDGYFTITFLSDGDIAQMQLVDQDTIIADMIACMREFR